MAQFIRRVIGALVLDAGAFEDIESDRQASMQSVIVVAAVCVAGGFASSGLGMAGPAAFITGALLALGAWLIWVATIAALGTGVLAEPQTTSNIPELLRVLGFAAAPGVFVALAVMRAAAPIVLVVVALWMIAAAVLAVRQSLDYRSTPRAIGVCVAGFAVAAGVIAAIAMFFTQPVS
jgi:hypothetical protein